MILFCDVETTGKPANYKAPATDTDNWPRVVQLGWQVYETNGKFLHEGELIVQPQGYEIPEDATAVHGITTGRAMREGTPIRTALRHIWTPLQSCYTVVCHNAAFDIPVIQAEFERIDQGDPFLGIAQVCTMKASTNLCKIPAVYKGYKWPKLTELYWYLFKEDYTEQHSALADTRATARCYWEMKRRGIL